jgi:hypothetical protein
VSARALAWAWQQEPKTTSQKLVLAALADRADDDGECWPSNEWIAEKCAPMPERTVRRNIAELAEQGFVAKVDRRRRQDGTLSTWLLRLPIDEPTGHERPVEPAAAGGRADLVLLTESSEAKASESPKIEKIRLVTSVWARYAPPLIQHRAKFLESRGTKAAIERSFRVYEADVVAEAIANYAACLGGDEFVWSHSWTLPDFLKRGLDRFVPEARPLENFHRAGQQKFGRRDVSAREFTEAARRLEAEQDDDERRELESG